MEKTNLKYFLAANSFEGFVSYFNKCYDPDNGWKAYIIKGGPGTGKSSFMKKISKKAEENEEKVILCPCSSDPNSLDAVIFSDKKTVILDGTAPHTVEPIYPAVCEEILNFGRFWNKDKITNPKEIIDLTNLNQSFHKTASKYLRAAGQIFLDTYKIAAACTESTKAKALAKKLCKKYIKNAGNYAYEWVRFTEGMTPSGIVSFSGNILSDIENTVIISDKYKACSNIIMNEIRTYCLINNYEIITVKNAFLPSLIIDHIIIPELSLAFVTESDTSKFEIDTRRIHARRFTDSNAFHRFAGRIKLNNKICGNLVDCAENTLKNAKETHDRLEKYYIAAMDFESLNRLGDNFAEKLFS